MEKQKQEYGLHITPRYVSLRGDWSTFTIDIIRMQDGKFVRGVGDTEFDNFVLSCQWDERSETVSYGWNGRFKDCYAVDRYQAKRMVKVFAKLDRATDKFPVRPETFGQWVAFVAKGLGLKFAVREQNSTVNAKGSSYDDHDYVKISLKDAAGVIDHIIEKAQKPEQKVEVVNA